jgi:transcriptional regulator with XRE-family HTH domain
MIMKPLRRQPWPVTRETVAAGAGEARLSPVSRQGAAGASFAGAVRLAPAEFKNNANQRTIFHVLFAVNKNNLCSRDTFQLYLRWGYPMADSLRKLGRRVRQLRTEKGLSQEKIAENSGISSKYVSDLERGLANVSVQILERVAANLGVCASDLLDNAHQADRAVLLHEIRDFLDTADDEKIRLLYRIMKSVV